LGGKMRGKLWGGELKVFAIVAELRAASCVALAVKRGLEQNLLLK